jgi:hypothetical protein
VATLVGTLLLLAVGADAIVRIWRSAGAWAPIDRGRAAFRLVWIGALAVGLLVIALGAMAILTS